MRLSVWVALWAAIPLLGEDAAPPPTEGAVVRALVKEADAERLTLKVLQVDRTNEHGQFDRVSGDHIRKLSRGALRCEKPEQIVQDALLKVRMIYADQGGEVLEVKAPGSYAAEEALPVAEKFAKARVKVREEMKEPHLWITDVLSMDAGDFQVRWGPCQPGSPMPIDPETLDSETRAALGIGTELLLELGPKGVVKSTVLSGGVKETKYKGVWLGVGAVLSIVALIVAWIVLRKKYLEI